MSNVVIAIDPGTVDTGICVALDGQIPATKKIHVPTGWSSMARIMAMIDRIQHYLMSEYEFIGDDLHLASLAYEQPVTFRDMNTAQGRPIIALFQLVAVLEYWAQTLQIATFAYPVNDIKEGVAGSRTASKKTVEGIMRLEYGWQDKQLSDHEWDAMSVYTYHLRQAAIAERIIGGARQLMI